MFARLVVPFYAIASHAVFPVSFIYALGLVGNYFAPKSVDVGGPANLSETTVVNLVLLGLFAIPHSTMARRTFKRWSIQLFREASQRGTNMLRSSQILLQQFWQWRPIPMRVRQIDGNAARSLIGVYWVGRLAVLASNFMLAQGAGRGSSMSPLKRRINMKTPQRFDQSPPQYVPPMMHLSLRFNEQPL